MGRALERHFQLDFTRSERADQGSIELPEGDTEYQLRGRGQSRPDLVELRWSPRLKEILEELRAHTQGDVAENAACVGRLLAEFLDAPAWSVAAPHVVERGDHEPMYLTVRSSASELYLLPWELLTVGPITHLGSLTKLLVRYEWPDTRTAAPRRRLSQTRRGRVIFAWSAAGGKVDAARHVKLIERCIDASRNVCDDHDRAFDEVKNATCESIVAALDRARDADEHVAVLHILCHGHGEEGTFGLALGHDEDHGGVDVVSPSRLQMLLKDCAGLVRLVVIAACDGSNAGAVGAHLGSVAQEVHKAGFGAVIASRFPLSWKGAYVFATALYESILARGDSLEDAFLTARSKLKPLPAYDWASMQLYARASDGDATQVFNWRPYRGLSAFAPEHARFFFGRDREIEELTRDLDALVARDLPRLLVVSGASGTGKSSMVLGGAIPRWRAASTDAGFAHLVVRPGAAPADALAQVRARAEIVGPMCRRFVVVVDQFEEVFTHRDSVGALALARGLWELASEPGSALCVIVTMRVDFLARCNELVLDDAGLRFDKIACDPTHQVLVAQMSPDQLIEAIEGPARAAGISLEAGVAREIVRDVEAAPGALPLMSHALYLLWARREGAVITRAAYKALGSVHGALDEHAEAQLAALRDDAERAVARRLMVSLVHPGVGGEPDTRRRCAVDELTAMFASEPARFEHVRKRLVDARLLVTGGEARAQTVEVAHEALIRSWKTFKSWIDADRTRLARLAQLRAWAAEWTQRPDAVLHGSRLGYAEEVEKEGADDLPPDVRKLLDASRDARRRELEAAARSRRVRGALIATAFATVSAFSGVGFTLWRRAEAARRDADEKRAAAIRSERAAVESEALSRASELRTRAESPGQELENLAAAIELRHDIVRRLGTSPRSVDAALFQTAAVAVRRPLLETDLDAETFALSPDGTRLAATRGGTAYLWNTRDGHLVAVCASRMQGDVERERPTFTPDSARMIVGFRNATACSVSARDGTGALTLGASDPISVGDATSATRHTLLIASDGSLALTDNIARDARSGAAVLTLPSDTPLVVDLRSEGDGRVVTVSVDAVIRRWSRDLRAPAEVELRTHGRTELRFARFSPDGARVLTWANVSGRAAVWSVSDGARVAELEGTASSEPRFSRDGRFVIAGRQRSRDQYQSGDTSWEAATGRRIAGSDAGVVLGFMPGGSRAFEVTLDTRTLRERDLATAEQSALLSVMRGSIEGASQAEGRVAVAVSSSSGATHLYNDGDGDVIRTYGTPRASCSEATFTPDGARVLVQCDDRVEVRGARDGQLVATLRDPRWALESTYVSRDGRAAIMTSGGSTMRLWDLTSGTLRASEGAPSGGPDSIGDVELPTAFARYEPVQFAADAPLAATFSIADATGGGAALAIWNLTEGRVLRTLRSPDTRGFALARFLRGGAVFAAMGDGAIRLYDANTGALTRSTPGIEDDVVLDVAVSPDGARAYTAHERDTIRVWNGRTGALEDTTRIASNHISKGAFSDDGRYLFTLSVDHVARLWEVATGRLMGALQRDGGDPQAWAFSHDGSLLATGYDEVVALWQTRDARLLAVIPAHLGLIRSLSFSGDGSRLATTGYDGAVRLWSLAPDDLTRAACALLRGSAVASARPSLQRACASSPGR